MQGGGSLPATPPSGLCARVCACIIFVQVMSRLCGNERSCTCVRSAGEVLEGAVPVIRGVVSSGRGGHQGQRLCVCVRLPPTRVIMCLHVVVKQRAASIKSTLNLTALSGL